MRKKNRLLGMSKLVWDIAEFGVLIAIASLLVSFQFIWEFLVSLLGLLLGYFAIFLVIKGEWENPILQVWDESKQGL